MSVTEMIREEVQWSNKFRLLEYLNALLPTAYSLVCRAPTKGGQ